MVCEGEFNVHVYDGSVHFGRSRLIDFIPEVQEILKKGGTVTEDTGLHIWWDCETEMPERWNKDPVSYSLLDNRYDKYKSGLW